MALGDGGDAVGRHGGVEVLVEGRKGLKSESCKYKRVVLPVRAIFLYLGLANDVYYFSQAFGAMHIPAQKKSPKTDNSVRST